MAPHELEEGAGRQVGACLTCEFNCDTDVVERDLNRRGGASRHEFIPSGGTDHDEVAGHQALVAVRLNGLRTATHLNAERDHRVQTPRWTVPDDAQARAVGREHFQVAEHPGFDASRVDGLLTEEIDVPRHASAGMRVVHCVTPCLWIDFSCIEQQGHDPERPFRQRP